MKTAEQAGVSVQGITKTFGAFAALKYVSLDIRPGEFVTLLGPSGCGKTTLLRIIAGLERGDSGSVRIGGVDVTGLPAARRGCGIVFQSYALFPNLTAAENVAFGIRNTSAADRLTRARELLDLVHLTPEADKHPGQLSGGQQQRVALARALAIQPRVLLLDEPLSALDAKVRGRLRGEICSLQRRLGLTTIMVTHDQEEALTMADRVVVMNRGEIAQEAAPEELYRKPADTFVADFVGHMNLLKGWQSDGARGLQREGLRLESSASAPAGRVVLAFRPESIQLISNSEPGLPARVESLEFLGAVYLMRLSLGDSIEAQHIRMELRGGMGPDRPRPGDRVKVHIPSSAIHVFPEPA